MGNSCKKWTIIFTPAVEGDGSTERLGVEGDGPTEGDGSTEEPKGDHELLRAIQHLQLKVLRGNRVRAAWPEWNSTRSAEA